MGHVPSATQEAVWSAFSTPGPSALQAMAKGLKPSGFVAWLHTLVCGHRALPHAASRKLFRGPLNFNYGAL